MSTCYKDCSLTVDPPGCGPLTDWLNNPGTCRLRIRSYVPGLFTACGACNASVNPEWDGTFPNFALGVYTIDAGVAISGAETIQALCSIDFFGGAWRLTLVCNGAPVSYIWRGASFTPLGVYGQVGGCSATPLALVVEAYP